MKGWIWKSVIAGSAGTGVHFLFMYLKAPLGLLPAFQPYYSFHVALSKLVGTNVPAIVPWALFMGLVFFPLIGLGPFAMSVGSGSDQRCYR
jgi:hypothetical protein